MLGCGIAPKGCATRPGRPALALDRDAAAKQVTVMPLWQNRASTAEFRLNQATSCEDVITSKIPESGQGTLRLRIESCGGRFVRFCGECARSRRGRRHRPRRPG